MPPSANTHQAQTEINFSKLKLLIVDDQRSAALMLYSMMQKLGMKNIDTTLSYQDAIERCKIKHYDFLLVDYHLDNTLNGFELLCLLRRRKYVSASCGVIMISGDSSTEVILTSMAVEPDSFITKPVTLSVLEKKFTDARIASQQRKPIYDTLNIHGIQPAIDLCKQKLRQQGHNHRIEELLLDLLIEKGEWEQAERFTNILIKENPTHKVSLIKARIAHHKGKHAEAIAMLQQLIQHSPLNIDAYDYLSNFLEEKKQYHEALVTAETALQFTPSISHRALKVAQLAANLDKSDNVIAAGKTLAARLPIIDISWLIRFAEFTAIFEQVYFLQSYSSRRKRLRQELKAIHQRAFSRLLPHQQPFLDCFGHITMARLSLAEEQPLKAKRRLMLGLSPYFDIINKLPSVILADVLPTLINLGETKIIGEINRALKLRDSFDDHSQNRLDALKQNEALIQSVKNLETVLAHCYPLLANRPEEALALYEQILIDYPYCTEAHLGRLQCLNQLHVFEPSQTRLSLQAISSMPLPEDLALWRDQLLSTMATANTSSPQQVQMAVTYQRKTTRYLQIGNNRAA
ncbi:response regulator [uncultured Photobacterium sp.]|uniref:response regulator n=1 Tax=uncultured Photobacterium sp. TaxID=173973 RepID=UPI0026306DC0|nr:response regulator [uncultured Photobacterium sp.]